MPPTVLSKRTGVLSAPVGAVPRYPPPPPHEVLGAAGLREQRPFVQQVRGAERSQPHIIQELV